VGGNDRYVPKRRVVWAIGICFFLFPLFYVLTTFIIIILGADRYGPK
jgi:hypothetical protein